MQSLNAEQAAGREQIYAWREVMDADGGFSTTKKADLPPQVQADFLAEHLVSYWKSPGRKGGRHTGSSAGAR